MAQQVDTALHMERLESMMFQMSRSLNEVCKILGLLVDGRDEDFVHRPQLGNDGVQLLTARHQVN